MNQLQSKLGQRLSSYDKSHDTIVTSGTSRVQRHLFYFAGFEPLDSSTQFTS